MLDNPAELDQELTETALRELAAAKGSWAELPVPRRIKLLQDCHARLGDVAEGWAATAARKKLLTPSDPIVGEEWFSGPYAVLAAIDALIATLSRLPGKRYLDGMPVRRLDNGQTALRVRPAGLFDRIVFSGSTVDVWLEPGQSPEDMRAGAAKLYENGPSGDGAVCLVLGAGNIAAITPLDVLHKLFNDNEVVLLKMNPVNAYLAPYFEAAFRPLIEVDALRIVTGDGALGAFASTHPLVDSLHITGAQTTHDRIVWGEAASQAANKANGTLVNPRPITSELGAVSPTIVVPGDWSAADIAYQAEQIALQKMHNSGFNCVASQVLILPKGWGGTPALLKALRSVLARQTRAPYYPGADDRVKAFARHTEDSVARAPGPDIPLTRLNDDPDVGTEEVFGPALALHEIDERDPAAFLKAAILLANTELAGTLGANIIIDPATLRRLGRAYIETLITQLRYGIIGVNDWTGSAFVVPTAPWGAFPGHSLDDVGSGIGKVHNALMLDGVERTVIWGAFRPFPRGLLGREYALVPKPAWLPSHRRQAKVARALTRFQARPGPLKLLAILWHGLRP
ncbi:MAG: aldehyde dehydrogenase family protein [Pseudomonadota bacterium]